uniref:interleukin-15 receptor subunit alpha n=1 Tax=Centroberyx gerrardi TaxID=166262 RepID=UPI003AADD270
MDLGSISAFITTMCLLGVAPTGSDGVSCECPCPPPPRREQTRPPQAEKCCEQRGNFRYTCVPGYLRKAGTSNLIKCTQTTAGPQWSAPQLQCIPDPRISTTTQTTTVTPSATAASPRSWRAPSPGVSAEEHTAAPPTSPPTAPPTAPPTSPPSSPGLPSKPTVQTQGPSAAAGRADRTTLGSTATLSPTAIVPPGNDTTEKFTGAIVPRVSAAAALLVACCLMAVAVLWWKRRRSQPAGPQPAGPQPTAEEQLPMNPQTPFEPTC